MGKGSTGSDLNFTDKSDHDNRNWFKVTNEYGQIIYTPVEKSKIVENKNKSRGGVVYTKKYLFEPGDPSETPMSKTSVDAYTYSMRYSNFILVKREDIPERYLKNGLVDN